MKALGELYYLSPNVDELQSGARTYLLRHAVSLAGARRGEFCPVELAEIQVPSSEIRLSTKWGVFLRTKVEHRPAGENQQSEIIDAWFRV